MYDSIVTHVMDIKYIYSVIEAPAVEIVTMNIIENDWISEANMSVAVYVASACNFIKKETLTQVLSCKFWEILRTSFLQNTYGRLLLCPLYLTAYQIHHISKTGKKEAKK